MIQARLTKDTLEAAPDLGQQLCHRHSHAAHHADLPAATVGQRQAVEQADDDGDDNEPETLPLLARRVMAGRQSIIPQPAKVQHY